MSESEHTTITAATRGCGVSQQAQAEGAGDGALPFHAAFDRAAADIGRGLFRPAVVSLVSVLALGFAALKVALYLAG